MNQTPSGVSDVASEAFIVGDLHVDVGQQRVTRAGIAIPLPNLSFQLLLALIRVAPNILSNDLLMARVWPGMIVSPETVAKRVNLLREALGDNAQEPRYIAGVRSRGYRLVATVSSALVRRRRTRVRCPRRWVSHNRKCRRHKTRRQSRLEQSPRNRAGSGGSRCQSYWRSLSQSP